MGYYTSYQIGTIHNDRLWKTGPRDEVILAVCASALLFSSLGLAPLRSRRTLTAGSLDTRFVHMFPGLELVHAICFDLIRPDAEACMGSSGEHTCEDVALRI